jgi:dsRNA-specific ribonuclease
MATGYMDTSEAAYETLEFLVDVCGEVNVLNELFDYMNVDGQVEFVHDFIRYHDVDTSEMNDETIRTIEKHYNRHC